VCIHRLLFSVTVFTAPLSSGFQPCSFLGFRVQRFVSSLTQLPSCTNWLPRAELTHNPQSIPYVTSARTTHKTSFQTVLLFHHFDIARNRFPLLLCLPVLCLRSCPLRSNGYTFHNILRCVGQINTHSLMELSPS
jgi:hypothetical protein